MASCYRYSHPTPKSAIINSTMCFKGLFEFNLVSCCCQFLTMYQWCFNLFTLFRVLTITNKQRGIIASKSCILTPILCFDTILGICRNATNQISVNKDRIKKSFHFNLMHTLQSMSTGSLSNIKVT